jgi:hypothetical protein
MGGVLAVAACPVIRFRDELIYVREKPRKARHIQPAFGGACTMECDHDYFLRRASEEREAAERAAHPIARQSHLELADRYNEIAEATTGAILHLNLASNG